MAESVKRRVAAARLAVAFVAAGAIAGSAAWAQAGSPPPTAKSSALNSYLKLKGLTSENILDGSLLFKDFKKGEVPSDSAFLKFKNEVARKYYPKVEIDKNFIKGQSSDYVKHQDFDGQYLKVSDADARFIKLSDQVVRGDGSVFTATGESASNKPAVRLLDVPNQFTVDATGPTITITNTSGQPLSHTACGANSPAGTLQPGDHMDCPQSQGGTAQTLQLVGADAGGGPHVSTISFSSITPAGSVTSQDTVQILIGL